MKKIEIVESRDCGCEISDAEFDAYLNACATEMRTLHPGTEVEIDVTEIAGDRRVRPECLADEVNDTFQAVWERGEFWEGLIMKYIVTIRRNDRVGLEEYDGGNTLEEARKEAAFFVEHTPEHVPVKICTVKGYSLHVVEVVRAERWGRM